jgi:hypothetical protein
MRYDTHVDWIDDFGSWEEVWDLLHGDWISMEDLARRLRLERDGDDLLVLEVDRRLRARQRRGLHGLGFRPTGHDRVTVWHWDSRLALRDVDVSAFASPVESMFDRWEGAARAAKVESLRRYLATAQLLDDKAQRVVRDVFGSDPADVAVELVAEDEPWDAAWDEDSGPELSTG